MDARINQACPTIIAKMVNFFFEYLLTLVLVMVGF